MKIRIIILIVALVGTAGVALGAFGAHALNDFLMTNGKFTVWETAVRYQMYHVLASLTLIHLLIKMPNNRWLFSAVLFFVLGIACFSGSLYLLCFVSLKTIALVTPLGGLAFMIGWILIIPGYFKFINAGTDFED